ncbi:MAG: D-alanine--D-alanine ligase [Candidatus Brocadiia bacterium]
MSPNNKETRVLVLCGGVSSEREVSLESGRNIADALRKSKYDVDLLDCDRAFFENVPQLDCDIAFLAFHGEFGEDGYIQKILEDRGLPFTGSGSKASALGMDKVASKKHFAAAGIQVPPGVVYNGRVNNLASKGVDQLGYPLVVKPSRHGSSIGLSVAHDHEELLEGIQLALKYDEIIVIEKFIRGMELTAGILENGVLPLIKVVPKHEVFDFACKYGDNLTSFEFDHGLTTKQVYAIERDALKAYRSLGCSGIARVDIIRGADGKNYILEINTIPGMTTHSLIPMAALQKGISFANLCDRAVKMAIASQGRSKVA